MKREPKIVTCSNVGCTETLTLFNSLVKWCSPKCGYELSQVKLKQKAYLQAIAGDTPKTKPDHSISHQKELTQRVFNEWVRKVKEKGATCCMSCRRPRGAFDEQAGHFVTVGHSNRLRYEPDNCWLQCAYCNKELSGNVAEFKKYLVIELGADRVEWLEIEGHKQYSWKLAELKDLRFKLNKEIREAA